VKTSNLTLHDVFEVLQWNLNGVTEEDHANLSRPDRDMYPGPREYLVGEHTETFLAMSLTRI
jgi:hypothetical protein